MRANILWNFVLPFFWRGGCCFRLSKGVYFTCKADKTTSKKKKTCEKGKKFGFLFFFFLILNLMESSVSSLMDHLNGVETRRRVVMMKRKEAETRLAFSTEEHQQLEQQTAQNEVRAVELKKELDHLLEEQRQLQLQLMAGMDTVRQSEVEEALLIEHARAQLEKATILVTTWREQTRDLDEVQRSWGEDDAAAPLQQSAAELDAELVRLCGEKKRIEQAIKEAMEAHALRAAGLGAGTAPQSDAAAAHALPAGDDVAAIQLKDQLELEQREFAEIQMHHARQMAALDREVADLKSRSMELAQWLADTVGSRDQVLLSTQLLQSCLNSGVCALCRPSS
ncbi:hypothetical protein, conserved [Trypanosoma cruzi]|uniref:Uncharacterized protein n=2 Tax=Trypanosoma cruzi TaxID=5693 RepID=Q4DXH8_TRYCC|nr:hypothetical protein, conserved [Trypanosoma cruzi]EAN97234.1 hypothetical protein, conserved [Trypanosoma cruzi]|eukprot:XP_819085.1 hypothetical protein [Trypanosoma cruzi strain CL Brener]